ncbi:hypothetical protein Afil01_15200 [Actinorhabdospora filicis]|uniref:Nudix hydrolase domain-containing protein n=1 Tax=Actinorhabdospora filicis TaxID=1785913 RepID=A0A9W6SI55_9ACTN|nr:hypothetical protein Afil01_15200 [Actinorhabdospora filicis]
MPGHTLGTVTGPETQEHDPAQAVMAAGALFTDEAGSVMLVKPTYKSFWDIPGGYVERGESPQDACVREVHEELGLKISPGPLLVVDWAPTAKEGGKLLFVFDGGRLSIEERNAIQIETRELVRYEFVPPERFAEYTIDRLVLRLTAALEATSSGVPAYLEHGKRT